MRYGVGSFGQDVQSIYRVCVCVNGRCRKTHTQHLLTTCDFLFRRFTFQMKIRPHIYHQRRLQVSKNVFFLFFFLCPKIKHVFLQTHEQCNNGKNTEKKKTKSNESYITNHIADTQGTQPRLDCNIVRLKTSVVWVKARFDSGATALDCGS